MTISVEYKAVYENFPVPAVCSIFHSIIIGFGFCKEDVNDMNVVIFITFAEANVVQPVT